MIHDFSSFGFHEKITQGLDAMRFEKPTEIQVRVIPEVMAGQDVIGCAQTGTGKTAAFLLPLIDHIIKNPDTDKSRALIVVPTRELAVQIAQQLEGFSYFAPISSLAIYGGGTGEVYSNEKRSLIRGVEIVVCTPGRMISHLNLGYVDFSELEFLILDEADRMLDMGFYDDIMKILSFLPKKRQSLLFSATMPSKIRELSRKILHKPVEINIGLSKPPDQIQQVAYVVYERQKMDLLPLLMNDLSMKSILVFGSTKAGVKQIARQLKNQKHNIEEIHSDLAQNEREAVMNRFKSRQTRILVATDIISRGIDIEDIDMVINYDVPNDAEDYVHRIGRTARAENLGKACTLIGTAEQEKFASIERLLKKEITKMSLPGEIGPGPDYRTSGKKQNDTRRKRFKRRVAKAGAKRR